MDGENKGKPIWGVFPLFLVQHPNLGTGLVFRVWTQHPQPRRLRDENINKTRGVFAPQTPILVSILNSLKDTWTLCSKTIEASFVIHGAQFA